MVLADVLERQFIRRLHEVQAEILDGTDVCFLRQRRNVTDGHVVDHPLTQRRDLLAHERLLSVGLNEQSSQRQVEDQRLALSIAAPCQGSEILYFPTYRKVTLLSHSPPPHAGRHSTNSRQHQGNKA